MPKKKLTKKGFMLNDIPMLAMVLVGLAIILGISATILTNMQDSDLMTGQGSVSASATFTADNVTAQDFDSFADTYGGAALSCTSGVIYNGSNNLVVTGNFTIDTGACTAVLVDSVDSPKLNGTTKTINYTRSITTYNQAYNNTYDGLSATSDLSSWQGTWVVVIAAAVVLGIIGKYLFFK